MDLLSPQSKSEPSKMLSNIYGLRHRHNQNSQTTLGYLLGQIPHSDSSPSSLGHTYYQTIVCVFCRLSRRVHKDRLPMWLSCGFIHNSVITSFKWTVGAGSVWYVICLHVRLRDMQSYQCRTMFLLLAIFCGDWFNDSYGPLSQFQFLGVGRVL